MGTATLAGKEFRLNPSSVSWGYKSKVSTTNTVGGRVVQVFGTSVSDITATGSFGAGGWKEQEAFLTQMQALADAQIRDAAVPNSTTAVQKFVYPDYGWDFHVMLRSFSSPDGSRSVNLDNRTVAPQWTLTLFIAEDRSSLKKLSQDAYLTRLSQGLGWKQTVFNGPMTIDEMQAGLNGLTVADYLNEQFGLGTTLPTGNQDTTNPSGNGPAASGPGGLTGTLGSLITSGGHIGTPDGNRLLGKTLANALYGWVGPEWDALLKVWNEESQWNEKATNSSSGAYGIPQSLPASKMASAGADWKTSPGTQIKWGLKYIKDRYGSPTAALAFHNIHNWY